MAKPTGGNTRRRTRVRQTGSRGRIIRNVSRAVRNTLERLRNALRGN